MSVLERLDKINFSKNWRFGPTLKKGLLDGGTQTSLYSISLYKYTNDVHQFSDIFRTQNIKVSI